MVSKNHSQLSLAFCLSDELCVRNADAERDGIRAYDVPMRARLRARCQVSPDGEHQDVLQQSSRHFFAVRRAACRVEDIDAISWMQQPFDILAARVDRDRPHAVRNEPGEYPSTLCELAEIAPEQRIGRLEPSGDTAADHLLGWGMILA